MKWPVLFAAVAAVLAGSRVLSRVVRRAFGPVLEVFCLIVIILKFAAHCSIFFYALHWLFLVLFGFLTSLPEPGFVLVLLVLIWFMAFASQNSLQLIQDGTMRDGRVGRVAVASSAGCVACVTLVHLALRFDKCAVVSPHAVEFCNGLPVRHEDWYFPLLILYALKVRLCSIQISL
jgi:hypothetical protein